MSSREKIDSIYDFTDKGLVEVKSWLEPWFDQGGGDCACVPFPSLPGDFSTAVLATPDLDGYWRLGEDSGDTFSDSSSFARHLAINHAGGGTNTYPLTHDVTGAVAAGDDGAAEFNIPPGETATQVQGEWLESASYHGPSSPSTFCGWIRCKTHGASALGQAFGTFGVSPVLGWGVSVTWPALTLQFMEGAAAVVLDGASSLIADTWYFVCVTDDGSFYRLYVNAAEVDSAAFVARSSPDVFRVGWGIRGGGVQQWRPFYGRVDEVAIWTRALTDTEIATLYNAGIETGDSGSVLVSDASGVTSWQSIVTVQTGAPTTYTTLLVFDDTAVTGGLWAWDGSAYRQIGPPL